MTHYYWISSRKGTCWVYVNNKGIICDSASLWKRFRDQPLDNLLKWLGNYTVEEINKTREAT